MSFLYCKMKYAIITDIHEDIESLKKVLFKIEKLKVDKIFCLGDIVGVSLPYHKAFLKSRSANACIDLIRENCDCVVVGNHDLHHVLKIPNNSNFKYPKNWYDLPINERVLVSENKVHLYQNELVSEINNTNINYLLDLKEEKIVDNILLSHFLYPNLTGSEEIDEPELDLIREHFKYMINNNVQISFVGHLHIKQIRIISTKDIINLDLNKKHHLEKDDVFIILCPQIVRVEDDIKISFTLFDTQNFSIEQIIV